MNEQKREVGTKATILQVNELEDRRSALTWSAYMLVCDSIVKERNLLINKLINMELAAKEPSVRTPVSGVFNLLSLKLFHTDCWQANIKGTYEGSFKL